jgi:glycosyltransferase involved in cell wall biosynthesis
MGIKSNEYISIVVPYFCRPHYLHRLIDSVHKYADLPFELLIHDDGSLDNSQPEVVSELNRVSTIILDTGKPLGLSASVNRLVRLCSSDYILMLNADCEITRPCFKEIKETLNHPYIGTVSYGTIEADTIFTISRGIGAGCVMGFRKALWEEVCGWNEDMHTPMADIAFLARIVQKGYFFATLHNPTPFLNNSHETCNNADSTIGHANDGYDNSYPAIFNLDDLDKHNLRRAGDVCTAANEHYTEDEDPANIDYWHTYMQDLVGEKSESGRNFNWAKDKYNHSRWKEIIERENL